MQKLFGLMCLYVCALFAQTVYPGSTDSAASLGEAKNRIITRLSGSLSASATSATVVSATGIVPNLMMTISGTEVVWVCGVSGNVVSFGKASCPNVDGRARDNSTATTHVSGATFENRINAGYFTFMRNAVIALEATSATNSSVSSAYYNFATQTPGSTLIAGGVGQSITLTPCPLGVAGANTHHYLYISGGTGTAEPILITGGTCTSGAATGTITTTPANAHSGAWTIKSATAGAQEACAVNSPCNLTIPAGIHQWYGTFWSPGKVAIRGGGDYTTELQFNNLNSKMFQVERNYFHMSGLTLVTIGTAVSGSVGIYIAGTGSNVASADCDGAVISEVRIVSFYNGLKNDGSTGAVDLYRLHINNSTQDGIIALSAQGSWSDLLIINNAGTGVRLGKCPAVSCGASPFINNLQTYNNGGWGVYSLAAVALSGSGCFLNNDYLGELFVNESSGTSADNGYIDGCYIQFAGDTISWGDNNVAPGILTATGSGPLNINNVHFYNTQGNSVDLRSHSNQITNSFFLGCGQGAQAGNVYCILTASTLVLNQIQGNRIEGISKIDGTANSITTNRISASSASPLLYIATATDAMLMGNTFVQAGAGTAYTVDGGVTLCNSNNIVLTGTVTNLGTLSATCQNAATNSLKVYSSSATIATLADATWTSILWNAESFDGSSPMHSVSADTGTINIRATGAYSLTAQGNFTANSGGTLRQVRWLKNGADTVCTSPSGTVSASIPGIAQLSCTTQLTAGDTLILQAYQNRGGTLVLIGATEDMSWASVARIQ